jgi:hypothetical protein
MTLAYTSLAQAREEAPAMLADHIARAHALHVAGELLMAGAFVADGDSPVETMAVCGSREAAEAFVAGDPFVQAALVPSHPIRVWANMFASR